jgi:hypothetical protein
MKLDPGMHIGLHLVFFRKTGVTLDLDPLGELVDDHQNSVESTWSSRERPNHVEPPAGERPGWQYGD